MPFKSKAQRDRFEQRLRAGEITQAEFTAAALVAAAEDHLAWRVACVGGDAVRRQLLFGEEPELAREIALLCEWLRFLEPRARLRNDPP